MKLMLILIYLLNLVYLKYYINVVINIKNNTFYIIYIYIYIYCYKSNVYFTFGVQLNSY